MSYIVDNCAVQHYSGVLYRFRGKSPKTTIIWQKVALSEISSELLEMPFLIK